MWSAVGGTSWSFGDGTTADGVAVSHAYAAPGTYAVTVASTDALGNARSASGTVVVAAAPSVVQPPADAPPTIPAPPIAPKKVPVVPVPRLTHLTQSHATWRLGRARAGIATGHAPTTHAGTTIRLTLSAAATLKLAFARVAGTGRTVSHRCVGLTRKNRPKPKCTRMLPARSLELNGHRGANAITFQGRLSATKTLKAGRYTVAITATAAGRTSKAATLRFTVLATK